MRSGIWVISVILAAALGWAAAISVNSGADLADEEEAFSRFSNALTRSDSFERTELLLRLAKKLTPETLPGAARAFREDVAQRAAIDIRILMWTWARQDPRGMVEEVQSWPDYRVQRLAVSEAVAQIVEQEGYDAAKAFFDSVPTGQRDAAIPSLILAFLEHEPITNAVDLLETYAVGEEREVITGILARHMFLKRGPKVVQEWVESLPPGRGTTRDVKRVAFRAVEDAHLDNNRLDALEEWLERVGDEPWAVGGRRAIAIHWVKRDPEAAIAWARALPAEQGRDEIVAETVRVFGSLDAQGARKWLLTQAPDATLDRGAGRVALYFARRDQRISLEMARRIVSDVTFENAYRSLRKEWKRIQDQPRRDRAMKALDEIAAARGFPLPASEDQDEMSG